MASLEDELSDALARHPTTGSVKRGWRGSSEFDGVPVLAAVKLWAGSVGCALGLTAAARRLDGLVREEPRAVSRPDRVRGDDLNSRFPCLVWVSSG
jgi:hypothetical protein